ncbi:hypothetical protein Ndes2526B_g01479 [Nannochloris sp. 'desiccata']|nr:hypothetical protein KSW81_004200 [Chlorella desiccata (nom. nud.)]KAH7624219.1 putative Succinate dehydrogenase assembly factor 2, mitochondrial [Chlorella desiccata (nom. nud.)]
MQQLRRGLIAPTGLRASLEGFMSSYMVSNNRALLSNTSQAPTLTCLRNFTLSHHVSAADAEQGSTRKAQINRMLYRARQRGWLELDLLVGMWAEREIERLAPETLNDLEVLLDQENPELYKWLTGQITPPASMLSNLAFQSIRGEVLAAMEAHGSAAAAAKDGAEWVNAWQEYKQQLEDAGAKLGGEPTSKYP